MEGFCKDCAVTDRQYNCESCEYNEGVDYQNSNARLDGPCGQQNCWYGCAVCKNNNGCYHADE